MLAARRRKEDENDNRGYVYEGHRIVHIGNFTQMPQILLKNLKCSNCEEKLSFANVTDEAREGFHSIFKIDCSNCKTNNTVSIGMKIRSDGKTFSDINLQAVLGSLHSGIGCTGLNKIFVCLDMPVMTMDMYKRYEREVGPAIEKAAIQSCKKAATEERRLVLQNLKELCKNLPDDIINNLYPHLQVLESYAPSNSFSNAAKRSSEQLVNTFDAACGSIINIIVSYDMEWSKRGNGHSYDSLNGYGAIIGFMTKKVLDYTTRNRKCAKCDKGHAKDDHDCCENYQGSAKAMEADAGVELINNSKILKEANLNVGVLIGDEDSSTISAIRRGRNSTIHKLADKNHLIKHFTSELYNLANSFKELKKPGAINHFKKCFSYAIAQNKGKSMDLANVIKSIPDHAYNRHENCGHWCKRKYNDNTPQQLILKDESLYDSLREIFIKYANNASKFSVAASSQANESLNNIITSRAPKARCYSRTESADYRVASAILSRNERDRSLIIVKENLNLNPGKYTASYYEKIDNVREKKLIKQRTRSEKLRRIELHAKRQNLRKKKGKI